MPETLIRNKGTLLDLLNNDNLARSKEEVSSIVSPSLPTPQNTNPLGNLDNTYRPIETPTTYTSKRSEEVAGLANMGGKSIVGSDLWKAARATEAKNFAPSAGAGVLSGVEGMVNAIPSTMAGYYSHADRGKSKRELDYANIEDVNKRDVDWHQKYDAINKKKAEEWDKKRVKIWSDSTHDWIKKTQEINEGVRAATGEGFTLSDAAFTIGQMAPSIAVGKLTGAVAGKILPDSLLAANFMPAGTGPASALGPLPASALAAGKAAGVAEAAKALQGVTSLSSMFAQVYGNEYANSRDNLGLDIAAASDRALSTATIETMTEVLGGGVPGMNEGILTRNLTKASQGALAKATAKFGAEAASTKFMPWFLGGVASLVNTPGFSTAIDVFGEGIEEGISEVYGAFVDQTTLDPVLGTTTPNASAADVMNAVLNGMVTSVFMQGVEAGIGNARQYRQNARQARLNKSAQQVGEVLKQRLEAERDADASTSSTVSDAVREGFMSKGYTNKDIVRMANVINELLTGSITKETKQLFEEGGALHELVEDAVGKGDVASLSGLAFDYFIKPFEVTKDTTAEDLYNYVSDYALPQLSLMVDTAKRIAGNSAYLSAIKSAVPDTIQDNWITKGGLDSWAAENDVAIGTKPERVTAKKLFAKELSEQIAELRGQNLSEEDFRKAKEKLLKGNVNFHQAFEDAMRAGTAEQIYGRDILQNRRYYDLTKLRELTKIEKESDDYKYSDVGGWFQLENGKYYNFDRFVEERCKLQGITPAELKREQKISLREDFNKLTGGDVEEVKTYVDGLKDRASKIGLTVKLADDMAGNDRSTYDRDTKTVSINSNKVRHVEALRYVLSHELVHNVINIDKSHRDSFIQYAKNMMNDVGIDYDERYFEIEQIKDADGNQKYAPEDIEEEVCTRFFTSLMSDPDMLMEMASVDHGKITDLIGYLEEINKQNPPENFQDEIANNQILNDLKKAEAGVRPEGVASDTIEDSMNEEAENSAEEERESEEDDEAEVETDTEETPEPDVKGKPVDEKQKQLRALIAEQEKILSALDKKIKKMTGGARSRALEQYNALKDNLIKLKAADYAASNPEKTYDAPVSEEDPGVIDPITGDVNFDKLGKNADPEQRRDISDVFKEKKRPIPNKIKELGLKLLSPKEEPEVKRKMQTRADKKRAQAESEAEILSTKSTTLSDLPGFVFKPVDVVLGNGEAARWIVAYPDETHEKKQKPGKRKPQGFIYSPKEKAILGGGSKGLGFNVVSAAKTGLDNTYYVKKFDADFYAKLVGMDSSDVKLSSLGAVRAPETLYRPYKTACNDGTYGMYFVDNGTPMMGLKILDDEYKFGTVKGVVSSAYRRAGFKYDTNTGLLVRPYDAELWSDVFGLPLLSPKHLELFNKEHARRWEMFADGADISLSGELKGWNLSVDPDIGFIVSDEDGERTFVLGFTSDYLDDLMGQVLIDVGGKTGLVAARKALARAEEIQQSRSLANRTSKEIEVEATKRFINGLITNDEALVNAAAQAAIDHDADPNNAEAAREIKSLLGAEWTPEKNAKNLRAELEVMQKDYESILRTPREQSSVSDIELNNLRNEILRYQRMLEKSESVRGRRLIAVRWKGDESYRLYPRGIIKQLTLFYNNYNDATFLTGENGEYSDKLQGPAPKVGFDEMPIEIIDVDSEQAVWDATDYDPYTNPQVRYKNDEYIRRSPDYLYDSNTWREHRRKVFEGFNRKPFKTVKGEHKGSSNISVRGLSKSSLPGKSDISEYFKSKNASRSTESIDAGVAAETYDEKDKRGTKAKLKKAMAANEAREKEFLSKGEREDIDYSEETKAYNAFLGIGAEEDLSPYVFDHDDIGNLNKSTAESLVNSASTAGLRSLYKQAIESKTRRADYKKALAGDADSSSVYYMDEDEAIRYIAMFHDNTTDEEEIKNYLNLYKFYADMKALEATRSDYKTKEEKKVYEEKHKFIEDNIKSLTEKNAAIVERRNASEHKASYAANQRALAANMRDLREAAEKRLAEIDTEEKRVSALDSRLAEVKRIKGKLDALKNERDSINKHINSVKDNKKYNAMFDRRVQLRQDIETVKAELDKATAKVNEVLDEKSWKNVTKNLRKDIEEYKKNEDIATQRAEMAESIPDVFKDKSISELLNDIRDLEKRIKLEGARVETFNKAAEAIKKSSEYKDAINAYNTEAVNSMNAKMADWKKKAQQANGKQTSLKNALKKANAALDEARKPSAKTNEELLREAISDRMAIEEELGARRQRIAAMKARLDELGGNESPEVADRIASIDKELAELEKAKNSSKEENKKSKKREIPQEVLDIDAELRRLNAELNERTGTRATGEGFIKTDNKERNRISNEIKTIENSIANLDRQIRVLSKPPVSGSVSEETLNRRAALQEQRDDLNSQKEELKKQYDAIREEEAAATKPLKEQIASLKQRRADILNKGDSNGRSLSEINAAIERLKEERSALYQSRHLGGDFEVKSLRSDIAVAEEELAKAEERLSEKLANAEGIIKKLSKGKKGQKTAEKIREEILAEIFADARSATVTPVTEEEPGFVTAYPTKARSAYINEKGEFSYREPVGGIEVNRNRPEADILEDEISSAIDAILADRAAGVERRYAEGLYADMFDELELTDINPDVGSTMLGDDTGRPIVGNAADYYDGREGSLNDAGEVKTYYFDRAHTPNAGIDTPYGKGFVLTSVYDTEYASNLNEVYADSTRPATNDTTISPAEVSIVLEAVVDAAEKNGISRDVASRAFYAGLAEYPSEEKSLLYLLALTTKHIKAITSESRYYTKVEPRNAGSMDFARNVSTISDATLHEIAGNTLTNLGYDSVRTDNGIILFDMSQVKDIHDTNPSASNSIAYAVTFEEAFGNNSWFDSWLNRDSAEEDTPDWSNVDRDYATLQQKGTYANGTPERTSPNKFVTRGADSILYNENIVPKGTQFHERFKHAVANGLMSFMERTNAQTLADARRAIFTEKRTNSKGQLTGKGLSQAIAAYLKNTEAHQLTGIQAMAQGGVICAEIVKYAEAGVLSDAMAAAWEKVVVQVANAEHEMGQGLQFVSALRKLSGQGRIYNIETMCKNLSRDLSQRKAIFHKNMNAALDAWLKSDEYKNLMAKYEAIDPDDYAALDHFEDTEIIPRIAEKIPSTVADRVNAYRYLCMLGNPSTHLANYASNMAMKYASRASSRLAGMMEDKWAEYKESKGETIDRVRSNKKQPTRLQIAFAVDNSKVMENTLTHGGKQGFMSKVYENRKIFGNSKLGEFANSLNKLVSGGLEGADLIFMRESYVYNMSHYLAANDWTIDMLRGDTELSRERLNRAQDFALKKAWEDTYRTANIVANALNSLEKKNAVASIIINGLAPFKRTPMNLITTGLKYSPVGLIFNTAAKIYQYNNTVMEGGEIVRGAEIADVFDAIGSGLTGTGISILGAMLAMFFGLKGGGSDNDREEAYDEMTGRQKYSVSLPGGFNITLDRFTPISMPFFAGVEAYHLFKEWVDTEGLDFSPKELAQLIIEASATMADPTTNLSMLATVDQAAAAIHNHQWEGFAAQTLSNYGLQFMPTATAKLTRILFPERESTFVPSDPETGYLERAGQVFINKAKNKSLLYHTADYLFGDNKVNSSYVDMWGEKEVDGGNLLTRTLKQVVPWYTRKINVTEVDDFVTNIFAQTKKRTVLPAKPATSHEISGIRYYMTSSEYESAQITAGGLKKAGVATLIDLPEFETLDPDAQVRVVENIYAYGNDMAKMQFAESRGFSVWTSDEEKRRALRANPDAVGYVDGLPSKIDELTAAGIDIGRYYTIKEIVKDLKGVEKKNMLRSLGVPSSLRGYF